MIDHKYVIHTFATFGPADQQWGAHFGDYDEGTHVATGPTEHEAIADLVMNYDLEPAE